MRVKEDFIYQDRLGVRDLAGKIFEVDFEVSADEVDEKAFQCNPACLNFCLRRNDFLPDFNKTLYYGHIMDETGVSLGYVMCEDELEEIE